MGSSEWLRLESPCLTCRNAASRLVDILKCWGVLLGRMVAIVVL